MSNHRYYYGAIAWKAFTIAIRSTTQHFQRIYVLQVSESGNLLMPGPMPAIDKHRDIFLSGSSIKSPKPIKISDALIDLANEYPLFLAGSIDLNSIPHIMQKLQLFGFDICRGVEDTNGEKSIRKVLELVK